MLVGYMGILSFAVINWYYDTIRYSFSICDVTDRETMIYRSQYPFSVNKAHFKGVLR